QDSCKTRLKAPQTHQRVTGKLQNKSAAPTAIGTAGNEAGHLGGKTSNKNIGLSPAAQWALLFVNFHSDSAEPVLPLVAAARERDIAVREQIERGEFDREPRADFAARMAHNEFLYGIRRRVR